MDKPLTFAARKKMTDDFKDTLYKIIGERIKAKRISLGLNQEDLADRLDISRASVSNIEKGRHQIPLITLYQVASILSYSISDILPAFEELQSVGDTDSIQLTKIIDSTDLDSEAKLKLNSLISKIDDDGI